MLVIIAPRDNHAEITRVLEGLDAAQLLRPVVVCTTGPGDEPGPEIVAERIIGGESLPVSLSETLAGWDLATLTTVVTAFGDTIDRPKELRNVAAAVLEQLKRIVPTDMWTSAALVTAPAAPDRHCHRDVFLADLDPWVVVAAEDRADQRSANRLVDDDPLADDSDDGLDPDTPRLARHLVHAVVTLAGAWSFLGTRPTLLDKARSSGRATAGETELVRCYSRIIDAGYLVDHVAADVLRARARWPNPDIDAFDDDPPLDDDQFQALADAFVNHHRRILDVTSFEVVPAGARKGVGIRDAIRTMVAYVLRRVRQQSEDWFEDRIATFYDSIATVLDDLAGPAGIRVKRWREQAAEAPAERFATLNAHRHLAEDGEVEPAWRDLWALTIGLCDGSDLPSGIDTSFLVRGHRQLIETNPQRLVPDPEDRPPGRWEGHGFRPCDPMRLDPEGTAAPASAYGAVRPTIDTSGAAEVAWRADRSKSLVWRIGARIARTIAVADLQHERPDPKEWENFDEHARAANVEVAQLRNRQVLGAGAIGLGLVVLMVAAIVVVPFPWGLGAIVAFPMVAVTVLCFFWLSIEVSIQEVLARKAATLEDLLARLFRAIVRETDVERLRRRYDEYLDWAEILGWYLHRPFVGSDSSDLDLAEPLDGTLLPAAARVGIAYHEQERWRLLCQGARTRLFVCSWLRRYYESVREKVVNDWLLARGVRDPDNEAPLTGFADTVRSSTGLRNTLVVAARRGDHRHLDVNPMATDLLEHLQRLPLERIVEGVTDLASGRDLWLGPAEVWTVNDADLRSVLRVVEPSVVRVEVVIGEETSGGTGFVIATGGLIVTCAHVVERADVVRANVAGHGWVAAAVVTTAVETDLAVLQVDLEGLVPSPIGSSLGMATGSSVFTLGFPVLLDGRPTLERGEVTSPVAYQPYRDHDMEVFQASYAGSSGSSGSPVYDATGHVVGVHVRGGIADPATRSTEHISFAVPAHVLQTFLAEAKLGPNDAIAEQRAVSDRLVDRRSVTTAEAFLGAINPPDRGALSLDHFPRTGGSTPDDIAHRSLSYDVVHEGDLPDLVALAPPLAYFKPLRLGVTAIEEAAPFSVTALKEE